MEKISLQEFANQALHPKLKQPLKTIEEVATEFGWQLEDPVICCGKKITVSSMIGEAYHAECKCCGKLAYSVTAPNFVRSSVQFLDGDNVDLETEYPRRWITTDKATVDSLESEAA